MFKDTTFKTQAPKFFQREFHQDTTFTTKPSHWPAITAANAEDAKNAYQRLAQVMRELNKPDDERFFARQELRCKAKMATGFWEKFGYWFYDKVSDFGESFEKPFACLCTFWLLGVAMFGGYFSSPAKALLDPDIASSPYLSAMGLSFGNTFAFLGINRLFFTDTLKDVPDVLQAYAGFQTVSGFILLFFMGLGLRNRFRLK